MLVDGLDVVLDGGTSRVGLESTILDCTAEQPVVLRPGRRRARGGPGRGRCARRHPRVGLAAPDASRARHAPLALRPGGRRRAGRRCRGRRPRGHGPARGAPARDGPARRRRRPDPRRGRPPRRSRGRGRLRPGALPRPAGGRRAGAAPRRRRPPGRAPARSPQLSPTGCGGPPRAVPRGQERARRAGPGRARLDGGSRATECCPVAGSARRARSGGSAGARSARVCGGPTGKEGAGWQSASRPYPPPPRSPSSSPPGTSVPPTGMAAAFAPGARVSIPPLHLEFDGPQDV